MRDASRRAVGIARHVHRSSWVISGEEVSRMRLTILGGTGLIGRALIHRALERRHDVTALVRTLKKLPPDTPSRLDVRLGDATDAAQLDGAVSGQDAVLSVLGPRSLGPAPFRAAYARRLLHAMERGHVRRLLMISAALVCPGLPPLERLLSLTVFRHLTRDHVAMEAVVRASDRDWTLIRPPRVTGRPGRGRYRVEIERLPRSGRLISAGDVADFMVTVAETGAHVREAVTVTW